ncbi:frigida-like protein, partial [Trifolium medium]|nr:frigida-like protein [Trifolium medium]
VIQKLIERGKRVLAVKFIFHFKLEDKTPPVPILKAFVNDAEQHAKRLAAEGKSLNEITSRQIHSLRSVIKVIETYNLDSEFPRASLEKRIDELNKQFSVGVKP